VQKPDAFKLKQFWGLHDSNGYVYHAGVCDRWAAKEGFKLGDVVGLLLDCDAGTLTVKKNGKRLGVAKTGLTGELCWAAALYGLRSLGSGIRIAAAVADGW
jgi:hypothetical protein